MRKLNGRIQKANSLKARAGNRVRLEVLEVHRRDSRRFSSPAYLRHWIL